MRGRALLVPVLVKAIVIQYLVQIKRRRDRREEQEGEMWEGAGEAAIKFLVRIYAHERRLVNGWDKSMPALEDLHIHIAQRYPKICTLRPFTC